MRSDPTRKILTGYLAQKVREVFPVLVRENHEGLLEIHYDGLIPWITEAIKALDGRLTLAEQGRRAKAEKCAAEVEDIRSRTEKLERILKSA